MSSGAAPATGGVASAPFSNKADIQARINMKMRELYTIDKHGKTQPNVCVCCDRFTGPKFEWVLERTLKAKFELFVPKTRQGDPPLPDSLKHYYRPQSVSKPWMNECLFSPRAVFKQRGQKFLVCTECKEALNKNIVPHRAIVNGWYFGGAPSCLTDLTLAELAMVTPVKHYGYTYGLTGGIGKKLKGTLGYFKVDPQSISNASAVTSKLAQMMNSNVVFILYGEMTSAQREEAKKKFEVRPEKVKEAIEWLIENNPQWNGVTLNDFDTVLQNSMPATSDNAEDPTVYQTTTPEQREQNRVIESEETFSVYFPDSSINNVYGGTTSKDEFERIVSQAQRDGLVGTVVLDFEREFTRDYLDDTFANSCLLQMPYGRGGVNEYRETEDGDEWKILVSDFSEHCSYISNPHFQHNMFILKLFNLKIRADMVKGLSMSLNGNRSVHNLKQDLDMVDFSQAAEARSKGEQPQGNATTRGVMRSLTAVSSRLPHSDDAASRPRQYVNALNQKFGQGGVFFTCTPDDKNTYLIKAYSGVDNDGNPQDLSQVTDDELFDRSKSCEELFLNFPGITALNFQWIVDILIEVVIGWDVENGCPTGIPGLFGIPIAFAGAIEEQGRTTLHIHFIIWLLGFKEYLDGLNSARFRHSAREIINVVDNAISTEFFKYDKRTLSASTAKLFPHDCSEKNPKKRKVPHVVDLQELRNLRHKLYHKVSTAMVKCPHCEHGWSHEDLTLDYMTQYKKRRKIQHIPDTSRFISQTCYECTKPGCDDANEKSDILCAGNNHHKTCHTFTCWKSSGSNRKHADECRMRFPKLPNRVTRIAPLGFDGKNEIDYYDWTGESHVKKFYQIVPKRHPYDLFINDHVPAVSESQIGGNTNASIVTPGPIGAYICCYPTKKTQSQNEAPYKELVSTLSKAQTQGTLHEGNMTQNKKESFKMLIRGAFVHGSNNVLGAAQAAYLTRNKTRFVFSHEFQYVPLTDLEKVVETGEIGYAKVRSYKGKAFADCFSLHYLARPEELNHLSPIEFFEKYEVLGGWARDPKKSNGNDVLEFTESRTFSHPSHVTTNTGAVQKLQVVREREKPVVGWFYQSVFQDTALFQRLNILESNVITEHMEDHAKKILLLCHSYRNKDDLVINGSYVQKLREIESAKKLDKFKSMLQNLQDIRGNNFRVTNLDDELQAQTQPYVPPEHIKKKKANENDDDNLLAEDNGEFLRTLQEHLDDEFVDPNNPFGTGSTVTTDFFVPDNLDLKTIRMSGSHRCGHDHICKIVDETSQSVSDSTDDPTDTGTTNGHTFVETRTGSVPDQGPSVPDPTPPPKKASRAHIVDVLFNKIGWGASRKLDICDDDLTFPEANGSALSIVNWGRISGLDKDQRRAFEVFAASHVLTYYNEANQEIRNQGMTTRNTDFFREKLRLMKLAGRTPSRATQQNVNFSVKDPLVCLLHGPGGSGKSAVIQLLMEYSKEYCVNVGCVWTDKTILVTAMSGVAATLIGGKTTHMACHLNKKSHANIPAQEFEDWKHVRTVIVDEFSFMSKKDVEDLNRNIQLLKQNGFFNYGGIDMIFCGDMRQLEPPGNKATPVYQEHFPELHNALNTYLELYGMHRFKDDPDWGLTLMRFRNGELTEEDIDKINTRVVPPTEDVPDNMTYATFRNSDRASINAGIFEEHCIRKNAAGEGLEDCLLIFASDLEWKGSGSYEPLTDRCKKWFYTNVGEGDVDVTGSFDGRFDPALMLYYKRPMMVNCNADVDNGIANGTRCTLSKVVLKAGVQMTKVQVGNLMVNCVHANQVEKVVLRHENEDREFDVKPKKHSFKAKLSDPAASAQLHKKRQVKQKVTMRGVQLPIVCNNATTGHKLQGATIGKLYVHTLSTVQNWLYVVLSRVKTLSGLYLRKPLNKRDLAKYNERPEKMVQMIDTFKQRYFKKAFSDEDYELIFGNDFDKLIVV